MSKIIIHNESIHADSLAVSLVFKVMGMGKISGENQYCWHVQFSSLGVGVTSMKTRGNTHTFKVRDEVLE